MKKAFIFSTSSAVSKGKGMSVGSAYGVAIAEYYENSMAA